MKFRNLNNPKQTLVYDGDYLVGYTGLVKFPIVAEEWEPVENDSTVDTGRKITNPSKNVYEMFLKTGYSKEEAEAASGYKATKTLFSPHF